MSRVNVLAIDAATEACSVALLYAGQTQERFEIAPREHAHLLLPMVQQLLDERGITLCDLDGIAVGRGPGAFTGVRIAMSMAQGLALGAALPVAPVSNLAALALRNYRIHGASRTLVVQDARMQEVYSGAFEINASGVPEAVTDERVSKPEQIAADDFDSGWHTAGNGWAMYPEALTELQQRCAGPPLEILPHAEDIARLAEQMLNAGLALDAAEAEPVYVRDDVARKSVKKI